MRIDPETPLPTSCRPDKLRLARALRGTPWHAVARAAERRLRVTRVFNFHGTPPRLGAAFGRQLDHLLDRYDAVDPYRLEEILTTGATGPRPAAIFTFDDGLRNHFTVAAEQLEQRGARGIFCLPGFFLSLPAARQPEWFRATLRAQPDAEHAEDDDLYAMSWAQARELVARGHRACSHSWTHEVFSRETPMATLRAEVVDSRRRLEDELGVPVDGFCWPVERDARATAAVALVRATYSYALVGDTKALRRGHDPLDVNRTRLEASWPLDAVDLQISGIIDGLFVLRRVRGVAPAAP